MLAVAHLAKQIGSRKILVDVSFQLLAGEILAISGANGTGKTTLLRLLAGIARPSAGKVFWDGRTVDPAQPQIRKYIGYVAHEPLAYLDLTGYENLKFFATAYGVADADARVHAVLQWWGLEQAGHQLVRTYSRGMRQRLALGRACLHRPRLLLLDEPVTGLDATGQDRLQQLIERHCRTGGAVVLTTHDPLWGRRLGAVSAELVGGKLVFDG